MSSGAGLNHSRDSVTRFSREMCRLVLQLVSGERLMKHPLKFGVTINNTENAGVSRNRVRGTTYARSNRLTDLVALSPR